MALAADTAIPQQAGWFKLFNLSNSAVAIVDLTSDKIHWTSIHWNKLLPALSAGVCWSEHIDQTSFQQTLSEAQQVTAYAEGRSATTDSYPLQLRQADKSINIRMCSLDGSMAGLVASDTSQVSADIQLYMQAREHMFTTSRTISVSEMATTLAHEIKQPIATISNILTGVELRLKRDDISKQQLLDILSMAQEQARFTDSVITRIRDFTQSRRPKIKTLDLVEILRESISLMDWLLSANRCRVSLELSTTPLLVELDPTMMQQVLVNIIRNGIEAMHDNDATLKRLNIVAVRKGNKVRISVKDNGCGLLGNEDTLFVPFSSNKASGMGVGLNICRSFVELHQGRLWLSPNDDGGCTSFIELPSADSKDIKGVRNGALNERGDSVANE